ncbi:MAG: PD-(D/E)XK nuclease family protein [Patescibacteria group bacterium]
MRANMSDFYKPNRGADWNYGGAKWKLSRSKIDLFLECPRCFYVDNRLGVARPPGFPFALNSAVDKLLKKEFDAHRAKGTAHPLMKKYGIDAVPLKHAKLEEWRDSLRAGVSFRHAPTGFLARGGVDDVWVKPNGELIVVDYKATSKDGEVNLDAKWQDGYKRQMEVYQWLFRQNGFAVSDTGYFVYVNGKTDREAFDARLEFDVSIIPYAGKTDWVEPTLLKIKKCLDSDAIPPPAAQCDYCAYRKAVAEVAAARTGKSETKTSRSGTLF